MNRPDGPDVFGVLEPTPVDEELWSLKSRDGQDWAVSVHTVCVYRGRSVEPGYSTASRGIKLIT